MSHYKLIDKTGILHKIIKKVRQDFSAGLFCHICFSYFAAAFFPLTAESLQSAHSGPDTNTEE